MSSDDDPIFKVQTIPPPPGESDVYNAPTKVGPMAASIVEEMILAAKKSATERQADAVARAKPDSKRVAARPEAPAPLSAPSEPVVTMPAPEPVPPLPPPAPAPAPAPAPPLAAIPRPATPLMAFPPPAHVSPLAPHIPTPFGASAPAPVSTPPVAPPPEPEALGALGPLLEPENAPLSASLTPRRRTWPIALVLAALVLIAATTMATFLFRH